MDDSEVVALQLQGPSGKTPFWLLQLLKPAQRGVVGDNREMGAIYVMTKLLHSVDDSQEFLLGHAVILLVFSKNMRGVSNRVIVSFIIKLSQDSSNSNPASIGV